MTRPVEVSLRLYRALARAFPDEFRAAYGDELLQVTEDAVEGVWRRHGVVGLGRLLADIALRVVIEHLVELRRDVRYGLRTLAASPGFTATALISLTLGIGVATSAFSELNGYILRDVPAVTKPEELAVVQGAVSYPNYRHYSARNDLFSGTLSYAAPVPFAISTGGHTERTWGHLTSASYFTTLGVIPALGRAFRTEDEQPGRAPIVVISHRFWQKRLGADPLVVGKALQVNGQPCTIVGVGPEGFQGASPMVYGADLWLPMSVGARVAPELADDVLERHDVARFRFVGRLRTGVSPLRAEAALDAIARQLEQQYGDPERNRKGRRVTLLPGGKLLPVPKQDLPLLTGFMAMLGGVILLIAGFNVANMLLARAADRRKEIAVRMALGAGRARLIRQLLTESMLVAAGAGVLGFLMTIWLMRLASRIPMLYPMPLSIDLEPDGRVLLFTLGLTIFAGAALGMAPALRATRADLTPALKGAGRLRLGGHRRLNLRNVLMTSQVAGSLALLLVTGFLVAGHRRITGTEVGFDPERLYLVSLDPVRNGYSSEGGAAFFQKLLERARRLPGVTSASLTDSVPMSMIGKPGTAYSVDGQGGSKRIRYARRSSVGKDFFGTAGIPIVRGRGFRAEDGSSWSRAAIVSENLARECWKGKDPLGQHFEIGNDDLPRFDLVGSSGGGRTPISARPPETFEVVGVAKGVRDGLTVEPPGMIYLPLRPGDYARPALRGLTLMVRAAPGVDAIELVRREVSAIDERITPFDARTMREQINQLLFPVRVALWTYGFVGVFGLILASVGLAGVTAHSVARRRREIGIRVALGASSRDVLGLVMKEGAFLVVLGTAAGLALAWAAMRTLAAAVSVIARTAGKSDSDQALLVAAPLLLAAVALVACYLPARKSLRVDPVVTLRQE